MHVEVDYASSAGLGDWLSIELSLGAVGTSSLEWKFAVFHSEHPVMSGRYVVVRVGKGGETAGYFRVGEGMPDFRLFKKEGMPVNKAHVF